MKKMKYLYLSGHLTTLRFMPDNIAKIFWIISFSRLIIILGMHGVG
jgi:hypothetical protein